MSFSKTKLIPAALQEGNSALNDLFNKYLDSLSALAMQLFAFLNADS